MKISSIREFRENVADLLRSKDPILVTRRGRLAGVFFPWPEASLPIELKRQLFPILSKELSRQLRDRGFTAEDIVTDFESWRKDRRENRRRR